MGVQVRVLFPALQAGKTVTICEPSTTVTVVAAGFMASLKFSVNVVAGDTPVALLAGTDESMVGVAAACQTQVKKTLHTSSFKSRPMD